jgi:hypothetical protein
MLYSTAPNAAKESAQSDFPHSLQELRTIVSEQSDQALSWCKSQLHMFEGDLIGFDTSVGKRRPLKSDMVVNSAEGRQFHRLPPMNATEPLGCRKYFHAPARNTRASMGEPIPFNCKCFFSVVQSMLEARHVAVLMTISPRSATEAKRAAMFTVSPTAVMS